jgi:CheY-like chemotaxis protein
MNDAPEPPGSGPFSAVARRALVLDDDYFGGRSLARLLERLGWQVQEAGTTREGMAALRGGAVDLVVTDYAMPGDDGVSFLRWVREAWPETRRVFYSATVPDERIRGALDDGLAERHFTKGDDLDALLRFVRELAPAPADEPAAAAGFCLVWGDRSARLVEGEWIVGRAAWASVPVADSEMSREHALLRVSALGVEVEDRRSANGTYVNGRRIHARVSLQPGDRVRLGGTTFVLERAGARAGGRHEATPLKVPLRTVQDSGEVTISPDSPAARPHSQSLFLDDVQRAVAAAASARTVVMVLNDRTWADQIRRAAVIHQDLRLEAVEPSLATTGIAHIARGLLLLDLDLGDRRDMIMRLWCSPSPRGPIILAGSLPDHEGAAQARRLGATAYIRRGRPSILVVGQLRYQLQRLGQAG